MTHVRIWIIRHIFTVAIKTVVWKSSNHFPKFYYLGPITFYKRKDTDMKKKLLFFTLALSFSLTACQNTPATNEVVEEVVEEVVIPEKVYTFTDMEFERTFSPKHGGVIRDLPCKDGNVVRNFEMLEEFIANATCNETGWYRINLDGQDAYVDPKDVEEIKKYLWVTDDDGNPIERTEEEIEAIAKYLEKEHSQDYIDYWKTGAYQYVKKEDKEVLGYTDDGHEIIAYNEAGNPVLGYTSDGYEIAEFDENGNPICYFTPSKNNNTSNSSVSVSTSSNSNNSSLPYIVNGIDIRSGDVDGDGDNDNNGNTWYEMQTWTASNGVTLRIADQYYVNPGPLAAYDSIFLDGTESGAPDSPQALAEAEYLGRTSLVTISPDNLPQVNTVSTKQTSINVNDPSLLAYKAAFDPLWKKQNKGSMSELSISSNSIGLLDATSGFYYLWDITYDASRGDWAFKVLGSYTKLGWDAVKNAIRMITPDANSVYSLIYQDFYEGGAGLDCEKYSESDWITVGSTQLKADWTTGTLYYRFK